MKKFIISSLVIAAVSFTSCDSYLDINTNPNSPTEEQLDTRLLFPAVEMAYAANVGDYLRSVSGYLAQYYAQRFGTSNYTVISAFEPTQARTSTFYTQFNIRVITNALLVKSKAEAQGDWATYLAATVIMASTYQNLIDMYGETPYTEAQNYTENMMPAYDSGETVYAGILNELDEAINNILTPDRKTTVSFLIPDGTAADWIKVANALKLKILMREHNVVNVSSQLSALIAENNFPTSDVEWAGCWSNETEKANPFYSEEFASWGAQKNAVMNVAIATTMNAYNDGRLPSYFTKGSDGGYNGSVSGTNMSPSPSPYGSATFWSRPNMAYNTPVSFISRAEIEFFLAEYYAENGDIATGASHYEAAINASFASAGVSGASAAIAAYPFTADAWKESLGVQKWVHLSGVNTFEGWCEIRRLKYPEFDTSVTGEDMYQGSQGVNLSILSPGHLYTPYGVYSEVGSNNIPQRFPYASASVNTNDNAPKFPGFLAPIFWAK